MRYDTNITFVSFTYIILSLFFALQKLYIKLDCNYIHNSTVIIEIKIYSQFYNLVYRQPAVCFSHNDTDGTTFISETFQRLYANLSIVYYPILLKNDIICPNIKSFKCKKEIRNFNRIR